MWGSWRKEMEQFFFKHEWVICQPVCTHAIKYSNKYTHIGRRELCDRNVRTIFIN